MNAHELNTSISTIFTCIDGPAKAFFNIPCIDRPPGELNPDDQVIRVVYRTVRVGMPGAADIVEPVLCGWAWARLLALIKTEQGEDRSMLLFWRVRPVIGEYADSQGRICTHLRMRLAIPGIDLSSIDTPEADAVRLL